MARTPNKEQSLDSRVRAINQWCFDRGINQKYTFFLGCDQSLQSYYHRIRAVLPRRAPVMESDAPWINSMEVTIETLNNRKAA